MSEEIIKKEIQNITKNYKKDVRKIKIKKCIKSSRVDAFSLSLLVWNIYSFAFLLETGKSMQFLLLFFMCLSPAVIYSLTIRDPYLEKPYDFQLRKLRKDYDEEIKELEEKLKKVNALGMDKEFEPQKDEIEKTNLEGLDSVSPELSCEYTCKKYHNSNLSKEELTTLKNNLLEELNVPKNEIKQETSESQLTNQEESKVKKYTMQ